MKRLLLLLPILLLVFFPQKQAYAQFDDMAEILRGGANDSNLLFEKYVSPYAVGLGANLNTGWNNSARPYRTLGFDLKLSAALAFVPGSDELFNVEDLVPQFQELELFSESGLTPTVAGSDDIARANLGKTFINPATGQEEELFDFTMPRGSGWSLVPTPMVQATVGLIRDTDLSLRFVPTISVPDSDGEFNLFGFSVKHGINQYLPGGTVLPIDLSVQFGYTKLNLDLPTRVDPESGGDIRDDFAASNWDGQNIELGASAYNVNLLVGRNLPLIAVFAGVGYQSSNTYVKANGAFPVTVVNEQYDGVNDARPRAIEEIVNPIDFDIDGRNSVHALAGFRVRLGFIALSASYTVSEYPVANVGVGLSFR